MKVNDIRCDLCGSTMADRYGRLFEFYLVKRQPGASGGEVRVAMDMTMTDAKSHSCDICPRCTAELQMAVQPVIGRLWDGKRA